ncbi:MAG: hypothetical protein AABZ32_04270 [Bacteroidota bacterium]
MEQPQYLIDSNAVIDYLGKKLPASGMDFMNVVVDAVPNVSVITKIGLSQLLVFGWLVMVFLVISFSFMVSLIN